MILYDISQLWELIGELGTYALYIVGGIIAGSIIYVIMKITKKVPNKNKEKNNKDESDNNENEKIGE